MFAVDADGGIEGLRLLRAHGINLPPAPTSRTANGLHVLLSAPGPIPDRVALLRATDVKAQVDIRGVGIIVAPPSIHPTGKQYAWEIPLTLPLPPAPQALLDLIKTGRVTESPHVGLSWVAEALRGVPEGQRDDTCAKLVGYFLHAGLDPTITEAVLTETFARNCTPPFPPQDVRKTVQSVARKDARTGSGTLVSVQHIAEVLRAWERQVDEGPPRAIRTPFAELNRPLGGGFREGELIYVGARAGVGKSALALEIARETARDGVGVLIVSREMVAARLVERVISQASRIPALTVRGGTLSQAEWSVYAQVRDLLSALPIWITDEALSVEHITGILDRLQGEVKIGLLIVDYLQLVHAPRDIRERRLQVESVSQALKTLAVQYKVPVVCMSSLSRAEVGNRDRRPQLSDLRESGELEHDADVILLLHRGFQQEETELIVAKNRNGRVGVTSLRFRPEFVAFEAATTEEVE
jgi:archaellum biogenesis ATPase FlaH